MREVVVILLAMLGLSVSLCYGSEYADSSQAVGQLLRSPAPDQISGSLVSAKSVTLPVYLEKSAHPALVVRFDAFYIGKKQKGFLKFGAWRLPIVEGLELQFFDQTKAAAAMEKAHGRIHSLGGRSSIDFRRVKFVIPGEPEVTLEAGRGEWTKGMGWRLSKGVTLRSGEQELTASEAFLRISPQEIGELSLTNAGSSLQTNLFRFRHSSKQEKTQPSQ